MLTATDKTNECPAMAVVEPQQPVPRKRLLVVEDSRCVQMRLLSLLQALGLDADLANDGEDACKKAIHSQAAGHPYDAILMDVQMPKMNGKQAAQWLRKNGWSGPIIAVSMHSTEKDRAAILAAGFTCSLPKPFSQATLRDTLAAFINVIPPP